MDKVCDKHCDYITDIAQVKEAVIWLKQDRENQKQRYLDLKKKKHDLQIWILGLCFTTIGFLFVQREAIRIILKEWINK